MEELHECEQCSNKYKVVNEELETESTERACFCPYCGEEQIESTDEIIYDEDLDLDEE